MPHISPKYTRSVNYFFRKKTCYSYISKTLLKLCLIKNVMFIIYSAGKHVLLVISLLIFLYKFKICMWSKTFPMITMTKEFIKYLNFCVIVTKVTINSACHQVEQLSVSQTLQHLQGLLIP